jgi:poly-gamma-glutamate system protein
MYRPSIKSKRTLAFLLVLAAVLFYWSDNSLVKVYQPNYDMKLKAARKMEQALDSLRYNRQQAGWSLDEVNDPNQSALIGAQYSLITTDQGNLQAKLTTINPNFAAVILQMLLDAGIKSGDKVAAGFTGSFPALNLAVIIACETLGAEPVIITSVGSSTWGANDPDFTYLDMENILFQQGVIHHRSVAASIGGGDDIGRSLSRAGRRIIEVAAIRNHVPMISGKSLAENITGRREIYRQEAGGQKYRLFVNVGGGVAVLGSEESGALIPPGLNPEYIVRNYPARGLIHEYWEQGLPIIHLLNVDNIAQKYGLPKAPVPQPPVGSGLVFTVNRYNMVVASISAVILFGALLIVVLLDRDAFKLKESGVDPDTLM